MLRACSIHIKNVFRLRQLLSSQLVCKDKERADPEWQKPSKHLLTHRGSPPTMISDVMIDLPDRFAVMRKQESTIYRAEDYLSQATQMHQQQHRPSPSSDDSNSSTPGVNEVWREKICEWSYQVVDHFDFNREIVSISLSYLDRFLSTRPVNKKIFQLAAMTTLYLAIKLNEQGTLKMSSLIELSRGYFMVEHIAAMEEAILR
mmetsp:Transcript_36799/g.56355  ORF Transcript_36799/g.56355 Transcript_36799/m.56355 type:complete len:203 (+) Transcript_36799:106-714(+)